MFAKAPVPGTVKTRLARTLGPKGAAELHRRLVRRTLATAAAARVGPVVLACAPDARHGFFADCAAEFGATLEDQGDGDLGERMSRAFERHAPALLVGTDCPALAPEDLREGAAALGSHDLVLGPAEDGGYVLIGLRTGAPGVFEGVAWGTSNVLNRTLANAAELGLRVQELGLYWDVDRPADLQRIAASLADGAALLKDLPR